MAPLQLFSLTISFVSRPYHYNFLLGCFAAVAVPRQRFCTHSPVHIAVKTYYIADSSQVLFHAVLIPPSQSADLQRSPVPPAGLGLFFFVQCQRLFQNSEVLIPTYKGSPATLLHWDSIQQNNEALCQPGIDLFRDFKVEAFNSFQKTNRKSETESQTQVPAA